MVSIKATFTNFYYQLKILQRERWQWVKLFVIMPVNMILPYYFMLKYFANENVLRITIYTTLSWAYAYFTVFESFMAREQVFKSRKLENLLISPFSLFNWIIGQTFAINIFYLSSFIISGAIIFLLGGIVLKPLSFVILLVVSFVNSVIFNILICSLQLRRNNIFHILNFSMDIVMIFACVIYPISFLPIIFRPFSYIMPFYYAIEFIRNPSFRVLALCFILCIGYFVLAIYLINSSILKYKEKGGFYV
ncbi:MAG TPA: hypothetical protein GX516_08725 [Thermoanaerobacter sp.]|nr:hypothetical protein [Thermoanaerobacter sp.]